MLGGEGAERRDGDEKLRVWDSLQIPVRADLSPIGLIFPPARSVHPP